MTNEEIDLCLSDRNIKRLSEYKNNKLKMKWKCLICCYEWETNSKSIINNKTGCARCNGTSKLTNGIVDERLKEINSNFVRIDDYINLKTKIKFKCEKCQQIEIISPYQIFNRKRKCKACSSYIKILTNEIFDIKIKNINENIERISDIKGSNVRCKFKCKKCQHKWETKPNNILSSNKTGCPKCNGGIKLNEKDVDKYLEKTKFVRMECYKNNNTKMTFLCKKCGQTFKSTFDNLKINDNCKICEKVTLTNEIIDERLKDINIKRIGDYSKTVTIKNKRKLEFKCLVEGCENKWKADVYNVTNHVSGCPYCRNKNENLVFKKLKESLLDVNIIRQKIFNFNNRKFRVDFYFIYNNKEYIVEYNGRQHYEPVEYFGGEKSFLKQQERDKQLREYCKTNDVILLEIPHWFDLQNFFIG